MRKIISLHPNKRQAGKATLTLAAFLRRYNPGIRVVYCRPKAASQ